MSGSVSGDTLRSSDPVALNGSALPSADFLDALPEKNELDSVSGDLLAPPNPKPTGFPMFPAGFPNPPNAEPFEALVALELNGFVLVCSERAGRMNEDPPNGEGVDIDAPVGTEESVGSLSSF